MTFALVTATRFQFSYDNDEQLPLRTLNKDLKRTVYPTTKENNPPNPNREESQNYLNNQEVSHVKSSTMKIMQLIQVFMPLKNGTFLFIAW